MSRPMTTTSPARPAPWSSLGRASRGYWKSPHIWTDGEAVVSNPKQERARSRADTKGDACACIGESRRLCTGKTGSMPRQRILYRRRTDDFPQRLVRFQEESVLPWSEIARRIGTYRHTVWR